LTGLRQTGVNMAAVKKIALGMDDGLNLPPGSTGTLHFDDVRLYRSRCLTSVVR